MIDFYIGGRGQGKTYQLIKWLSEYGEKEGRIMLVHSNSRADELFERYKDEFPDLERWQFAPYNTWKSGTSSISHRQAKYFGAVKYGIDDLDTFLEGMLPGMKIVKATASGKSKRIPKKDLTND